MVRLPDIKYKSSVGAPTRYMPYTLIGESLHRYDLRKHACQHRGGVDWSTVEALFLGMVLVLGTNPTPEFGFERTEINRSITGYLLQHVHGVSNEQYNKLWVWASSMNSVQSVEQTAAYLADFYLDWVYTRDGTSGVVARV